MVKASRYNPKYLKFELNFRLHDTNFRIANQVSKLKDENLENDTLEKLKKIELNGRKITNMVRLGKIVFENQTNETDFIKMNKNSFVAYDGQLIMD